MIFILITNHVTDASLSFSMVGSSVLKNLDKFLCSVRGKIVKIVVLDCQMFMNLSEMLRLSIFKLFTATWLLFVALPLLNTHVLKKGKNRWFFTSWANTRVVSVSSVMLGPQVLLPLTPTLWIFMFSCTMSTSTSRWVSTMFFYLLFVNTKFRRIIIIIDDLIRSFHLIVVKLEIIILIISQVSHYARVKFLRLTRKDVLKVWHANMEVLQNLHNHWDIT